MIVYVRCIRSYLCIPNAKPTLQNCTCWPIRKIDCTHHLGPMWCDHWQIIVIIWYRAPPICNQIKWFTCIKPVLCFTPYSRLVQLHLGHDKTDLKIIMKCIGHYVVMCDVLLVRQCYRPIQCPRQLIMIKCRNGLSLWFISTAGAWHEPSLFTTTVRSISWIRTCVVWLYAGNNPKTYTWTQSACCGSHELTHVYASATMRICAFSLYMFMCVEPVSPVTWSDNKQLIYLCHLQVSAHMYW